MLKKVVYLIKKGHIKKYVPFCYSLKNSKKQLKKHKKAQKKCNF